MTTTAWIDRCRRILEPLSREQPVEPRYQPLVDMARELLHGDAAALLQLEGETLRPVAVSGLSHDTLGRRFRLADHPRLRALLQGSGPTRLAADCELPDPYDGLIEGIGDRLEVHDCLGCPVATPDGTPWGLLTLDALDPHAFEQFEPALLERFGELAAAAVAVGERLAALAQRALRQQQLAHALAADRTLAGHRELLGRSAAIRRLQREIDVVAATDLTVLITGETGTGKELVAQALHARSRRSEQPMIALNCAALQDNLVESELFGHVRGAFTGAVAERRGRFELADGGTLLLDEIGELALPVQAKLLRVLQSGQLQRLGSDREHRVDVRVLAATNRDLAAEVRAGRFRADLYHRLSVYPLQVPPLRERGRDVLLLAGSFLEENRVRLGLRALRLAPPAQNALLELHWPGNVRELEHVVSRAAVRALARQSGPEAPCEAQARRIVTLQPEDLGLPDRGPTPPAAAPATPTASSRLTLRQAVQQLQQQMIAEALERHGGNRAAAARELGLDRGNLHRLMKRLATQPPR